MRAAEQRTCRRIPPSLLLVPQGDVGNRRVCETLISHHEHIIAAIALVETLHDCPAIGRFKGVVHMIGLN